MLGEQHSLDEFDCGVEILNGWLKHNARRNQKNDVTQAFVVTADGRVRGYYSLAAAAVARAEALRPLQRNAPDAVPIVLLGRLAVDVTAQDSGLGTSLLQHALLGALVAAEIIGARAVAVDAIDEAAARFYEPFGFQAIEHDPLRLYLPVKTIRQFLTWLLRGP